MTRRVVVNGKVVAEESTTDSDEANDPAKFDEKMRFKQNLNLPDSSQQFFLGRKAVNTRTYPLHFSLSDFYYQHSDLFKNK